LLPGDGDGLGLPVGDTVGKTVGDTVGETVGDADGLAVGETVGKTVGDTVGDTLGDADGLTVGKTVGETLGLGDGEPFGLPLGLGDGEPFGEPDGEGVGVTTPKTPETTVVVPFITATVCPLPAGGTFCPLFVSKSRNAPLNWLTVICPTTALFKTTFKTVPCGRLTEVASTLSRRLPPSSVRCSANPPGVTPPIAGPVSEA
jgi:hypothetical protein